MEASPSNGQTAPSPQPPPGPAPQQQGAGLVLCSPSIAKLALALAKAQGEFTHAVAKHVAKVEGKEGKQGYSYNYASMAEVIDATAPALAKHELAVLCQVLRRTPTAVTLRSTLVHSSGEWAASQLDMPLPERCRPQDFGAVVTYGQRYLYLALIRAAAGDDNDAQDVAGDRHWEPDPEEAHRLSQKAAKKREAEKKAAPKSDAPAPAGFAKPNLDKPIVIFGKDKKGKFIAELTGEQLEAAIKAGQGWLEKNAQHDSRTDMQLNVQQLEAELKTRLAAAEVEGAQMGEAQ